MARGRLSDEAERILHERLHFCEERDLEQGAAYYRGALETWDQANYEYWVRIDDLSAHPKDRAESEFFRS